MKNYILALSLIIFVGIGLYVLTGADTSIEVLARTETTDIHITPSMTPANPLAGETTTIHLKLTNKDGTPATDLMEHHARRVHVLLVGENLNTIGHIHPEDFSATLGGEITPGEYAVTYTFPESGRYIMGIDIATAKGPIDQQFIITVEGSPKMSDTVDTDFATQKCFRGYQEESTDKYTSPVFADASIKDCATGYDITFTPTPSVVRANEPTQFKYTIEKAGMPVTNLSPYLGAPQHFAIIPVSFDALLHRHGEIDTSADMKTMGSATSMSDMQSSSDKATHVMEDGTVMAGMVHTEVPKAFGPHLISEEIIFAKPGIYKVFSQIKHEGQIVYNDFLVEVQ